MKLRVIIISVVVLLAAAGLFLVLSRKGEDNPDTFETGQWERYSEVQLERHLEALAESGTLPEGQENELLGWIFTNHFDMGAEWVRNNPGKIQDLPFNLCDTAWGMIRNQQTETGLKILGLAQQVYPNDPDVLGFMGIVYFLQGKRLEARQFLEEAETWRRNRPIVNFYLGGLLVQSENAADRTRGKTIMMGLVRGADPELRELAGLTLLSDLDVPLQSEDIDLIYTTLEKDSVFTVGNKELPIEALRVITTRLAGPFPERAMEIASLMMEYPNTTPDDYVSMIRFAQLLGHPEISSKFLDALISDPDLSQKLNDDPRIERLQLAQEFLEGHYESGMNKLRSMVESDEPDVAELQETFRSIMNAGLPMSTEEEVLELYLRLPIRSPQTSLTVLARLRQINPLGEEEYIRYAVEHLLPENPTLVGSWLTDINATEQVISAILKTGPSLSGDQYLILINAYLKAEDEEKAQAALDEAGAKVDPALQAFFQSRIWLQRGDIAKATPYWEEAYQLVSGSTRFPLMKNLGFLALELNQPVNALSLLYTAFTAGIPFTEYQSGQLIELTLSYGNLRQSIQVAEYLADEYPQSAVHKNNLAYFKFLAEEDVESSIEVMRELVEAYPDIHQYRLTLALGLVKAGRTNEASRLLKSTNINWENTSNRGRMIYAVVLAANDQRVVAEGLLQNLDQQSLIPEERALLEEF